MQIMVGIEILLIYSVPENCIHESGAKAVAEALLTNRTITTIYLSGMAFFSCSISAVPECSRGKISILFITTCLNLNGTILKIPRNTPNLG